MSYIVALIPTILYSIVQILLKRISLLVSMQRYANQQIAVLSIACIFMMSLGFVIWTYSLSRFDLTEIYWITAASYIIVPALSAILLKETVSSSNLIGYTIITIGIVVASTSSFSQQ